jgi:hypothetical protein
VKLANLGDLAPFVPNRTKYSQVQARVSGDVVVLVEGNDEQAVVGLGPLIVDVQLAAQPLVSCLHAAAVHVICEIRDHEGDGGQLAIVGWEQIERQVASEDGSSPSPAWRWTWGVSGWRSRCWRKVSRPDIQSAEREGTPGRFR